MPYYHAFNLNIESDIEIPHFLPHAQLEDVDVSISLDPAIPQPAHISALGTYFEYISTQEMILGWPTLGWFRVKDGQHITLCPLAGVSPETCTLPLFGLVFATLLQQRQEYVLHGSGVEVSGLAAIFIGDKGYGKSTLASWFMSEGAQVVTDDVAAVFTSGGQTMLRSGFPLMKLWPTSLERIGKKARDFERIIPEVEKRSVQVESFCDTPVEIGGIFILGKGDGLELSRLSLADGLIGLARNMMGCGFAEERPQRLTKEIFENAADILRSVPVYSLTRPEDLGLLAKTASLIKTEIGSQRHSTSAI